MFCWIDKLIRSKRRTLSLEVAPDARLIVRAPLRMPLELIDKFILRKRGWVQKKQLTVREKLCKLAPREFADGESFLYLGEKFRLSIVDNSNTPLALSQDFQLSRNNLPQARQVIIEWYKKQAQLIIQERVKLYASLMGHSFKKFRVSNAKKRWGSCTTQDTLNFSWRLIMAPLQVIDYVVVHELAHLKERNHKQRFWRKVQEIFPEYKGSRKWLRENGHLLTI